VKWLRLTKRHVLNKQTSYSTNRTYSVDGDVTGHSKLYTRPCASLVFHAETSRKYTDYTTCSSVESTCSLIRAPVTCYTRIRPPSATQRRAHHTKLAVRQPGRHVAPVGLAFIATKQRRCASSLSATKTRRAGHVVLAHLD